MAHIARLPGWPFRSPAESASLSRIAVVADRTSYGPAFGGGQASDESYVRLFERNTYGDKGRIALPRRSAGGANHPSHGRWTFFDSAGNKLDLVNVQVTEL